jgi:hypothetical protein
MRISDATIYMTDNGATYCGAHLGTTARMTGRDISGQPIMAVTPDVLSEAEAMGYVPKCETCGKAPSRLHVAV